MFDDWSYRPGFEAAMLLRERGKSAAEVEDLIRDEYPDLCERHGFVRGYKRGLTQWCEPFEASMGAVAGGWEA